MTRDEIIRMALEAGFLKHADALYTNHRFGDCIGELERFAALVAAAERERFATPQRKPLTDDQLDDIAVAARSGNLYDLRIAIERAHETGGSDA